jgi:hypothetical protein
MVGRHTAADAQKPAGGFADVADLVIAVDQDGWRCKSLQELDVHFAPGGCISDGGRIASRGQAVQRVAHVDLEAEFRWGATG